MGQGIMNEKKEYYHLTEQFTPITNMIFATDGNGVSITVIGAIHDLNTLRYANECLEEELRHLHEAVRRCEVFIDIKERTNNNLHLDNLKLEKENEQLKQQISYYEKLITDKEVEWLRNNTVWEQMPSSKRTVTKTSK